ncbi:hypothetical protein M758_6G025900 [Ceratodon purpureus]|nr:hypothetical protein M758_6G025900 [Ceratodon purpureus]
MIFICLRHLLWHVWFALALPPTDFRFSLVVLARVNSYSSHLRSSTLWLGILGFLSAWDLVDVY